MSARLKFPAVIFFLLLFAGCNAGPSPEAGSAQNAKPAAAPAQPAGAKPVEFMTGHAAFDRLLAASHTWAQDARPVTLQSPMRKENPRDGKSDVWGLIVVSPSKKQLMTLYWSSTSAADAPPPGILAAKPADFDPKNPNTVPFDPAAFKIDSEKALGALPKQPTDEILKKPGTMVSYMLKWNAASKAVEWNIGLGTSDEKPEFTATVDAGKGTVVPAAKK